MLETLSERHSAFLLLVSLLIVFFLSIVYHLEVDDVLGSLFTFPSCFLYVVVWRISFVKIG